MWSPYTNPVACRIAPWATSGLCREQAAEKLGFPSMVPMLERAPRSLPSHSPLPPSLARALVRACPRACRPEAGQMRCGRREGWWEGLHLLSFSATSTEVAARADPRGFGASPRVVRILSARITALLVPGTPGNCAHVTVYAPVCACGVSAVHQ